MPEDIAIITVEQTVSEIPEKKRKISNNGGGR
jgi:hypothetical protein